MTRIVVDRREPMRLLDLLTRLELAVTEKVLWAGDYEVGEGAIVERKTVRGLHLDVVNGTLWPQLGRLRRVARFPYLMIEGRSLDEGPLSPSAIRGTCIAAMDLGIQVIRSESLADSAAWLHRLVERRMHSSAKSRPAYAQRPQRPAGFPAAEAALSAVPGVSETTARALLNHFGSLAGVVAADPSEWQQVRGVGRQRSKAMALTFHSATTASGSGRSREPPGRAT